MRRPRPDDGAVAVELVEVGPDSAPDGAPDGIPHVASDGVPDVAHADAPPRHRRTLWWVGAGVIVALVVTVAVANVAEARREAARREALAELPWVLPPLSGPLEEVWRAPGGYVLAESGRLLVVVDPNDLDQSLVAVDRESGAVAWQREGHGDYCQPLIDTRVWETLTAADSMPEPELLVCLPTGVDTSAGGSDGSGGSAVEVVDVPTGHVVAQMPVEGVVIGSETVEDDVVVTSVLTDGSLQVVRAVGRTEEPVWTYRSEPSRVPPDGAAWAYVDEDVVLVDGDVTVAVSLETGREVPVPEDAFDYGYDLGGEVSVPLSEGVEVRYTYEPTTGRAESGRVVEADGSTRFTFDGGPWLQGRSDGSAADVFVVRQDDTADDPGYEGLLLGFDLATGEQLWSVLDEYTQRLLQIDGLAVATGGTTSVIDVRTGRQLWERPVSGETAGVPLTDGDTVLLPERGEDGYGFAAVDLRTGVEEWWMPAPIGVIDARVADNGLVLLLTTTEIVAYR